MQSPVRHELIHQINEAGIVRRLQQVHEFVDDDVLEALLGLLCQFSIEPNRAPDGVAASPLGLHPLHKDPLIKGFEEIEDLPNLIDGLQRHGYKDDEIKMILGRNYLRVLKTILPERSVI